MVREASENTFLIILLLPHYHPFCRTPPPNRQKPNPHQIVYFNISHETDELLYVDGTFNFTQHKKRKRDKELK